MIPMMFARDIMQINGGMTGSAFDKYSKYVNHCGLQQLLF